MMFVRKPLAVIVSLFLFSALQALPVRVYVLQPQETETDLTDYCILLNDPGNQISMEEVLAGRSSASFVENKLHQPFLQAHPPGFSGWVKLSIFNPGPSARSIFLSPSRDVDSGMVYWKERDGLYSGQWGTLVKTSGRTYPRIGMTIAAHDTLHLLMRIRGDGFSTFNNRDISVTVSDQQTWLRQDESALLVFGVFYGVLFALICYSFAVYFVVRRSIYFYFIAFIFSALLFYIKENEIGAAYIWGDGALVWLNKYGNNLLFGPLAIVTGFTFCRKFLHLRHYYPKLDRVIAVLSYVQLFSFLRLFIGLHELMRFVQNGLVVVGVLLLVSGALAMARRKNPDARLFLLVFLFALAGIAIHALRYSQLLPQNVFTQYAAQLGIGITALAFAMAIGAQVRQINKAKRAAEKEALEKSKEIERLTKEQNILLEQKVEERTRELQETQDELLRQEKLASLGKLANRIAHEMQNPLNFVNNFSELSAELIAEYMSATNEERLHILSQIKENMEKINHHGQRADQIVKSMLQHLNERKEGTFFGE